MHKKQSCLDGHDCFCFVLIVNLFFLYSFIYDIAKGKHHNDDDSVADDIAVFGNRADELVFRHDRLKIPTESCKHGIPYTGTEGSEGNEFAYTHLGQAGRDRDELSNGRHKASDECSDYAVLIEELLCSLDLLLVDETHVTETAVGKLIHNRFAEPKREVIVD